MMRQQRTRRTRHLEVGLVLSGLMFAIGLVGCGPPIILDDFGTGSDSTDSDSGRPVVTTGLDSGLPPPPTLATTSVDPPSNTTVPDTVTATDTADGGEPPVLDFPEYCDTLEQDCPPGYKCMPYASDGGSSWNDTKCVQVVDNPNGVGESCTVVGSGVSGEDDCDALSMCWDVDPRTLQGLCVPFCIGTWSDPSCADTCDHCTISGDGTLTLCLSSCDPLLQQCPQGQACYPINNGFTCAPDASGGMATLGDPCEFINVCPAGQACLAADVVPNCEGAAGCCSPYCPVGGADPCPGLLPGTTCVPFFEDPADGPPERCISAPVGVCVVEP